MICLAKQSLYWEVYVVVLAAWEVYVVLHEWPVTAINECLKLIVCAGTCTQCDCGAKSPQLFMNCEWRSSASCPANTIDVGCALLRAVAGHLGRRLTLDALHTCRPRELYKSVTIEIIGQSPSTVVDVGP